MWASELGLPANSSGAANAGLEFYTVRFCGAVNGWAGVLGPVNLDGP